MQRFNREECAARPGGTPLAKKFISWGKMGLRVVMLSVAVGVSAQTRPADVKSGHWAEGAVSQALANRVMSLENGKFAGEKRVTKTQAVISLAALAKLLESHTWQAHKSAVLSAKIERTTDTAAWEKQLVSRYTLAIVLSKFGNYFANGVPKPAPNAKDLAKSDILPSKPKITVAKTHPAYASLTYLADRQMISAGSPLLKPDDTPIRAQELSKALTHVSLGLTNQVTELGLDENGGTPDKTFRNKKR